MISHGWFTYCSTMHLTECMEVKILLTVIQTFDDSVTLRLVFQQRQSSEVTLEIPIKLFIQT